MLRSRFSLLLFFSIFLLPLSSQASQHLDVDGDGNADILWRNQTTGQNWLWTMNGVVVDESKSLNSIPLNWEIVGRGDFDGDGKSDILWRNNDSGRNYIYLMDGFTIRTSQELNYLPNFDWKVKGVTDLNGDGKDDIVWHHQTSGKTWIYLIDGISITSSKAASTVADLGWEIVGTGDVNGDGNGDVIWRHNTTGDNYIWQMNGTNIIDSYVLNNVPTSWNIVGLGDLNGDGTDDIIWRSASGLNWAYLMNDGQVGTSKQINTIANQDWQIRTVGDLNGDGKADIFWRNQSTGKTYAYLMDGTSILTAGYSSVISLNWEIISESTLPTSEEIIPEEPEEPEEEPNGMFEAAELYGSSFKVSFDNKGSIIYHFSSNSSGTVADVDGSEFSFTSSIDSTGVLIVTTENFEDSYTLTSGDASSGTLDIHIEDFTGEGISDETGTITKVGEDKFTHEAISAGDFKVTFGELGSVSYHFSPDGKGTVNDGDGESDITWEISAGSLVVTADDYVDTYTLTSGIPSSGALAIQVVDDSEGTSDETGTIELN